MRNSVKVFVRFGLGLLAAVVGADRFADYRLSHTTGTHHVGREVRVAIDRAREPGRKVRAIYLGDSVARQLFPPGGESSAFERFLPCNQAISLGGQCYLLEDALSSCPKVRDVYLFYYPGSFENDLASPPLTNDYFCGFFHRPAQIAEVFSVKRDCRLAAVQTGRFLLPGLMAANSDMRPAAPAQADRHVAPHPASFSGEPVLDMANVVAGGPRSDGPPLGANADGSRDVILSLVSRHYLARMRQLCDGRGVRFHVLPCPCSSARPFRDPARVYEREIVYVDATEFRDEIHLQKPFIDSVREQIVKAWGIAIDRD